MKANAAGDCKVKAIKKHDRLSVTATWSNAQKIAFSITRSGERVAATATDGDLDTIQKWMSGRPGENHGARIDRLARVCEGSKSLADVLAEMSK